MPKITRLVEQKKNPKRISVFLDNVYAFGLDISIVGRRELHVGQVLSKEDCETLMNEDVYKLALNKAMNYLSYQSRTEHQMHAYLVKKEIEPPIIKKVMEALLRHGLIDDERFVEFYMEHAVLKYGPMKIKMELKKKGIDEHLIEDALYAVEESQMLETARKIAKKKCDSFSSSTTRQQAYTRLTGLLQRRGFSYGLVKAIVSESVKAFEHEVVDEHVEVDENEILELVKKRNATFDKALPYQKRYQRLSNYCLRRGYSYDAIKDALRKVLKE